MENALLPEEIISYIAYEFQEAAADILVSRVMKLLIQESITTFALVGGVSANTRIREKLQDKFDEYEREIGQNIDFYTPIHFDYCTDNAAMIGLV